MTVKETLTRARQLIENSTELNKGTYYTNGNYCTLGALKSVVSEPLWCTRPPGLKWLAQALVGHPDVSKPTASHCAWYETSMRVTRTQLIATWNDRDETTKQDVLDLYDRAIESAP